MPRGFRIHLRFLEFVAALIALLFIWKRLCIIIINSYICYSYDGVYQLYRRVGKSHVGCIPYGSGHMFFIGSMRHLAHTGYASILEESWWSQRAYYLLVVFSWIFRNASGLLPPFGTAFSFSESQGKGITSWILFLVGKNGRKRPTRVRICSHPFL